MEMEGMKDLTLGKARRSCAGGSGTRYRRMKRAGMRLVKYIGRGLGVEIKRSI